MSTEPAGPRSHEWRQRALSSIPGAVNSNIRLAAAPVVFARAQGATLWDVDGRDYIDYVLGRGPAFLGHAYAPVDRAVAEACADGMVFGASHVREAEAAERVLAALGWAERVRLGMTGTECVQAALRLARAATGRRKFVRFDGHYHGWLDNVLIGPDATARQASDGQVAQYLTDSYILEWNDADALADLLAEHGDEIGAVLMEPMMVNTGCIEPLPGYLRRVRELCDRHQVVLIFDEVITGFRLALGGAAQYYGVVPDLAIYGKAVGGGWPVAAVAGRADLMDHYGSGRVNHSGTFNGSVMAAAAVVATLQRLTDDPPYERVAEYGRALMRGLAEAAAEHEVALHLHGVPAAFYAAFGPPLPVTNLPTLHQLDLDGYARFTDQLVRQGLWVMQRGLWFVSAAHGEPELDETLRRFRAALKESGPGGR